MYACWGMGREAIGPPLLPTPPPPTTTFIKLHGSTSIHHCSRYLSLSLSVYLCCSIYICVYIGISCYNACISAYASMNKSIHLDCINFFFFKSSLTLPSALFWMNFLYLGFFYACSHLRTKVVRRRRGCCILRSVLVLMLKSILHASRLRRR